VYHLKIKIHHAPDYALIEEVLRSRGKDTNHWSALMATRQA
jgi:hypothetical protein